MVRPFPHAPVGVAEEREEQEGRKAGRGGETLNLALYCTVAEAAEIANVTEGYIRVVLGRTKGKEPPLRGEKVGRDWLVLRADAVAFERKPGMGRPKKTKKAAKRKPRRKPPAGR